MALIVRCPSCGAVWRLPQPVSDDTPLECSACHQKFPFGKADTLTVDDERLRKALPKNKTQSTPSTIIPEKQTRQTPQKPTREEKGSSLWSLLAFIFVICLGVFAASLYANQWVLRQAPWLQPVYEKACGVLPCPDFIWQDAKAIQARARLLNDTFPYQIELTIQNTSDRIQAYPVLEISFLDISEQIVAQRLTEPQEYGVVKGTTLQPQSSQTYYLQLPRSQKSFEASHVKVIPLQKL